MRRVSFTIAPDEPCNWCRAPGSYWDRIAGKACCPDCEEALAAGEAPPLTARTERHHCAVCHHRGSVPFLTFPLHAPWALAVDLCPVHFRSFLARRLGPAAFQQLRRQLHTIGLSVKQVFLLHEVFYDPHGQALQPVLQPDD